MLGFKRRKRVEGWAIDVSQGDAGRPGIIQRIADNNKAWIVCLAGVMVLTLFLAKMSDYTIGGNIPVIEPRKAPTEFRDRARYSQFEYDFRTDKRFSEVVVSDRFLSPGRFQLTVAGGVSADEIDYVAKMAARRVSHEFHHRTVVQVYKRNGVTGEKRLIATAKWEPKNDGYTVTFQPGSEPSR